MRSGPEIVRPVDAPRPRILHAEAREQGDPQEVGPAERPILSFADARIVIVDDEASNVRLLERLLRRAGYQNVVGETDPSALWRGAVADEADLILLDLHMPRVSGMQLLRELRLKQAADDYLPVVILTADVTEQTKHAALEAGATDFVTKPFDHEEVLLRVRNVLQTRYLHQHMERQVLERTRDLERSRQEVLERLSWAAEFRDDDTGEHTRRVGALSARIAEELGLPSEQVELIRRAAPLHDVGKIGIPDAILLKPGPLTAEEWEVMKSHTTTGARILMDGDSELIRIAAEIALHHHEKWNGGGYPNGLRGEEIPIEARVVALADFWDALTHDRPYRKAWDAERVRAQIRSDRGEHFDPDVVDAFYRMEP